MRIRSLLTVAAVTLSMTFLGAGAASAKGWGGADNPDWDNDAAGVAGPGRCAPISGKSLKGTFVGQDGLGVNSTIGFDFVDSRGVVIDVANGCPTNGAYSSILQTNHWAPWWGQKIGSVMEDEKGRARGYVGPAWAIDRLPANATHVWIETYIRGFTGSPCGMGCAGTASTAKYGWTNRRLVSLHNLSTYVRLIAPTTPYYGGQAGNIDATLVNAAGSPVNYPLCGSVPRNCVRVYAWSMNVPEGSQTQGWGSGAKISTTTWRIRSLASNQPYRVRVQKFDGLGRQQNYEGFTRVYKGYYSKMSVRIG